MDDNKSYMAKDWLEQLRSEFEKPYMKELRLFLDQEETAGHVIYPPRHLVFNAFRYTPFQTVKVVLVGQDPYHGPGQAQGLCFSVPPGVPSPPSLKNIFKEMVEDLGIPLPSTGCLIPWAQQGVFLLNAILTVRSGQPLSHQGKGWERFTDEVIRGLFRRKDPLVFILWGRSAQDKCLHILKEEEGNHLILKAAHPSFFSAHNGFFGCRHFSQTNRFLEKVGKRPIQWDLP